MKIIHGQEVDYIPASHESFESPGVLKKILLRKDDCMDGRVQMVNWALLPGGKAFQAHYHEDMQEIFIIMSGRAKIAVAAEEEFLEAGDTVVVPAGSVHRMENTGCDDVAYIVIGISSGQGGRTIVTE
ncbi:MAG: cupin domain-containing protein [Pseudomonadota bacterium]